MLVQQIRFVYRRLIRSLIRLVLLIFQILIEPSHRQRRRRHMAVSSRVSYFPLNTTSRRALYSVRHCLNDAPSCPIDFFLLHVSDRFSFFVVEFSTDKYHPIELSLDIPMDEKIVAMIEWWSSAHELFLKYGTCSHSDVFMCTSSFVYSVFHISKWLCAKV